MYVLSTYIRIYKKVIIIITINSTFPHQHLSRHAYSFLFSSFGTGLRPYTKYIFRYKCSERSLSSLRTPAHSTSTSSRPQPRMRVKGASVYGPMASICCSCW